MGSTKYHARKVREQLEEDEVYVITHSKVKKMIKKEGNMSSPWRNHIVNRFERSGWKNDNGVYYNPEGVTEKVGEFSKQIKSETRPVISKSIVSQEIADIDYPSGEWGEVIDKTMRNHGWALDEENGLYYLPPAELVTESSLAFYLLDSFKVSS